MSEAARQLPVLDLAPPAPRADHSVITRLVREGASVLDIGCGNGALLAMLAAERGVRGRGLDLNQANVNACVARGLSAVQADADHDLVDFPDSKFDYVVIANAIQRMRRPRTVLQQAARIGERVIVSFANYGHWRTRLKLLTSGRIASAPTLSARWCDSDNIHPCSVRDFAELARETRLTIERAVPLSKGQHGAPFAKTMWRANWFAEEVVFVLSS